MNRSLPRKHPVRISYCLIQVLLAAIILMVMLAFRNDIMKKLDEISDRLENSSQMSALHQKGSELSAEEKVRAFAQENQIPFETYPQELIALLERNPETEAFVLNYPWHEDKMVDLSAYDRSSGVPLFLQWDTQWGYTPYGSGMLAITGCGPTCLAMVGYYLTGEDRFSPDKVAAFSLEHGFYSHGNGSSWTLISEGGSQLGLEVRELPLDYDLIEQNLSEGRPIICVVGPGDFTQEGHFLVLTGADNGMLTLNDPNSVENSKKIWSYEQIESQIRNLWAVSA